MYVWNTRFILIEDRLYTPELGAYRSFGIMAVRRSFRGCEQADYVPDISADREFVSGLVEQCNRAGLSPAHLRDVVADALGC